MTTEAEVYELLQLHFEVTISGTCVYSNHAGQLHRVHGPAIKWADGDLEWYQNGVLHREDGPAVVYADRSVEWWIYGTEYTQQGYHEQLKALGLAL